MRRSKPRRDVEAALVRRLRPDRLASWIAGEPDHSQRLIRLHCMFRLLWPVELFQAIEIGGRYQRHDRLAMAGHDDPLTAVDDPVHQVRELGSRLRHRNFVRHPASITSCTSCTFCKFCTETLDQGCRWGASDDS